MAPAISKEQQDLLIDLFYTKKISFGRDRIWTYIKTNYPESKISRRQVADWLSEQQVHQVYTRPKKRTSTRPIISNKVGDIFQADIIDFTGNPYKGFKYILNVIDVLSRKVWLFALKTKSVESVKKCFDALYKENVRFKVVQTDQGGEFEIDFSVYGAKHIKGQAYTPQQQSVIERSNGTIKTVIKKHLYIQQNNNWVDMLDDVENAYNDTFNTTTKHTPNELYNGSLGKQTEVADQIKNDKAKGYSGNTEKFEINDHVRVLIAKKKDSKLEQNYTQEVFKIKSILKGKVESNSVDRYKITDLGGVPVKGTYNASRLLKIGSIQNAPGQKNIKEKLKKLSRAELDGIDESNILNTKRRN